jgi:DNA-binding transcriptional ArsR family regulator
MTAETNGPAPDPSEVDAAIAGILEPLRAKRDELTRDREVWAAGLKALDTEIRKVERIIKAAEDKPAAKTPTGTRPSKVSDKRMETILEAIRNNAAKTENAPFTIGDVAAWGGITPSAAGEALRRLRREELVRLIGRQPKRKGHMGLTAYEYRLMEV